VENTFESVVEESNFDSCIRSCNVNSRGAQSIFDSTEPGFDSLRANFDSSQFSFDSSEEQDMASETILEVFLHWKCTSQ